MVAKLFHANLSVLVIFHLLLFVLLVPLKAQDSDPFCSQAKSVLQTIEKYHFQPIQTDNKWSKNVFNIFVNIIDPQGLLFTQVDYKILKSYEDSLDDYILTCKGSFFTSILTLYKQRLIEADTIISQIMAKPFNFSEKDTLTFYNETIIFAKDKSEIKKRWKNLLKYRVLIYLLTTDANNPDLQKLMVKEFDARKIIIRKQKQRLHHMLSPPEGFEKHLSEQFFNAIAQSFDPHTSYFSQTEKNNFEASLSSEQDAYGFETDETEIGEIEIVRLLPGGPAWKSNELHKGDILLSIKWKNDKIEDLTLLSNDEIENLFESSTEKEMELTIRKSNGQTKTVKLHKERIASDENLIKSYILKGNRDIGFISLPGFYTEWDNDMPSGCSTDMAKEIIKLKKENIEGIIIDLRFNGGGSLGEALSLAGIFIDEGPLSIIKNRNNKPIALKDYNRGTIYDGPLLLLVNNYSASASEILAAVLQDYNRAIIVGSPTFGKATSQIITPLELTSNYSNVKSFVKVTTGKIYRVTGKSHQRIGVIPDILIPDFIDSGQRESNSKNALVNDSISKKYIYNPLPEMPLKQLNMQSIKRLSDNYNFQKNKHFSDSISLLKKTKLEIPLYFESFRKNEWNYFKALLKTDSTIIKKQLNYTVINNNYDKQIINLSPFATETNNELIENIENDIYIEECYQIITDLLNFKNN